MLDPYRILEISRDATMGEIKKAYFRLVKKYPPEQEPEKFKSIREAYEKLRTVAKRAETDLYVLKEPTGDFEYPDKGSHRYDLDVTAEDFLEVITALYADLNRTDFRQDFTPIG
jgi:curved DNA-binding protein CbpA